MEISSNVTLVVFMVFILLSRYINSAAVKKLPMEKKAELIDEFSGFSVWSIAPLLVLIGAFYFVTDYIEENHLLYMSLFFAVAVVYVVALQVYVYKKLKNMDYPMSYIKQYILSVVVRFVGLLVLLYPMLLIFIEN